ncbi:MAG: ABC transporter substrate-binding protein [Gammaproteobacteria bacterium]|nr:ABC transporter substrate-binding protein [Gammaproteobacteria bacterium]MCP5196172.1 ABC transporter substrate-binding protein [Gammaproteobacteria bacterium]
MYTKNNRYLYRKYILMIVTSFLCLITSSQICHSADTQRNGVTPTSIRVGSIMDLDDETQMRSQAIKLGLENAFKNEKIEGRTIELAVFNDSYNPQKSVEGLKKLIEQGTFVMIANTGGPTVKAELPLLAENKVPAVGFPIGVDFLRPGIGDIINFRPSFGQEAELVLKTALSAGVKPKEICVYTPNDAGGIGNLKMFKAALEKQPNTAEIVLKINEIIALPDGDSKRNGIGPVGFFERHTQKLARPGYESLKKWEETAHTKCRLVMLLGGGNMPTSSFIGYANYKQEKWIFSVTSQLEVDTFIEDVKNYTVLGNIILTQVVPSIDSSLPIVNEAREILGDQLNSSSLEGYIVGKMFLVIMRNIKGDITRTNFLAAVRGKTFDLGGLALDFTSDNQGSDFVQPYFFEEGIFKPYTSQQLQKIFQ